MPSATQLVAEVPVERTQTQRISNLLMQRATQLNYKVKNLKKNKFEARKHQGLFLQNSIQFEIEVIPTDARDIIKLSSLYKVSQHYVKREFKSLIESIQLQ